MFAIAPSISCVKQIGNISDVIRESNYEQELAAQCVFRTRKTRAKKFPTQATPIPGTEPVKEKQRVAKGEVILEGSPFVRREVLGIVAHCGIRNVDTFPAGAPEFPAQIHVLAIHEKQALVESARLLKCRSPDQRCGAGT